MEDALPDQTTALKKQPLRWKFKSGQTRWLIYLLVLLGVAAWKYVPRPWHPSITLETAHHIIYSSASRQQTEDTAHAMNLLYDAYSNRMGTLPQFQRHHPKLKVKLFKDRDEFRWINPGLGWAGLKPITKNPSAGHISLLPKLILTTGCCTNRFIN
jgi:hypothetical protein